MAKVRRGEYTLVDIAALSSVASHRTAVSPFGKAGELNRYVGRAVAWKMVKGIENVRAINAGVADGLMKAISISQGKAGVGGVVLVRMASGSMAIMPRKSAEQSIGRPVEVTVRGARKYKDRVVAIVRASRSYGGLLVPAAIQIPA